MQSLIVPHWHCGGLMGVNRQQSFAVELHPFGIFDVKSTKPEFPHGTDRTG